MKKIGQDFIIDRLTDSILNKISGESFQTEISTLKKSDLKSILKKNGWNFDWKAEFNDLSKEVYKLTIINNSDIIQGLLSITMETDYIFVISHPPFF